MGRDVYRLVLTAVVLSCVAVVACSSPPDPDAIDEAFARARALDDEARHDEAIAVYEDILQSDPDSFDGHYWIARAMDLAGRYDEAREHFGRAIELSTEGNRDQTLRMMGIAWTFAGNADEAGEYFRQVFDRRLAAGNPAGASEVANELGRVYLELGDVDRGDEWYRRGYDTAAADTGRSEAQADLAELRWAHAQARIAARRDRPDEARAQVSAVEALVDKGTNTGQEEQLAYLRGYVALYGNDPAGAVEALQAADQSDPFILLLLARASEAVGDTDAASAYYGQVLESTSHAVNNAFARPIARRWLEAR